MNQPGVLSERTLRSILNETMRTLRRTKTANKRAELLKQIAQLRVDIRETAHRRLTAELSQLDAQQSSQ